MKISEILIHYIAICISTTILVKVFEKYSKNKIKLDKKLILKIMIISIAYFINNMFVSSIIRVILATVIAFLLNLWIYQEKVKKTIYYTLVLTIILHVIDLLSSLFLPLGIKNIEILNQNLAFKVIFSILVNVIFYFASTNKYVVKFLKKYEEFPVGNKIYYILCFIGLFTCNFWLFYLSINTSDKVLSGVVCFTELAIIVLLTITFYNQYEKNISKVKEDQIKQNLKLYSKVASEYKELTHNLMNDFLIIKTKLPKKEQNFMNEIINKYKSNYDWVNDITEIPEGLQGLVFLKKNQAELKKITFNIEYNVNKNIEKLFEINTNFRLYESLGIFFDNAIEGAYESKEKMINAVFSYNKNTVHISIFNTFNNDIDLDKIGSKDYSTKNRGSGIGLNYIKRQKNKFKINQSIQGNIFITDIIINHQEKK